MKGPVCFLRRLFLQPIRAAEDRDRRLQESVRRIDHATRTYENAVVRMNRTADKLHALTEQVIERNRWPGDGN